MLQNSSNTSSIPNYQYSAVTTCIPCTTSVGCRHLQFSHVLFSTSFALLSVHSRHHSKPHSTLSSRISTAASFSTPRFGDGYDSLDRPQRAIETWAGPLEGKPLVLYIYLYMCGISIYVHICIYIYICTNVL